MKIGMVLCLAMLAAGVAACPSAAVAQTSRTASSGPAAATSRPAEQAGKPRLISNVFTDTDLRQVLQDIATQAGVIIVPNDMVNGPVSCELKDVPLDRALEIVLAGSGFVAVRNNGYYVVGSCDPKSAAFGQVSLTRAVRLNYAKASSLMKLISPAFRAYVQADEEANTLCITAPKAVADRLLEDVRLMDRPPRHIVLDARIVVLERQDLLNIGIEWDWPQVAAGTFTNDALNGTRWPWGLRIGYTPSREFTNALLLTINLLSQNEQATVLASPQVTAQDGKEAQIAVNTEEYFEISSQSIYTQSVLQKVESGTILKIVPRLGENGDITLEMSTEVSDVVARGENNLPVITRRTAKSTVRVEDGGTAAVAGLMVTNARQTDRSVPGMAAMPLLGGLFRNETKTKIYRQVAIFVTARLMDDAQVRPLDDGRRAKIPPAGADFRRQLQAALQRNRQAKG
jgi:type II secretory pathway component GspD/PulD (secretin)